jgi:hypothetical protein
MTKHYRKMKQRQRAHHDSIVRKRAVLTLTGGEVAPGRENRGDNDSWANMDLTRSKIKKIHTVDSFVTIGW